MVRQRYQLSVGRHGIKRDYTVHFDRLDIAHDIANIHDRAFHPPRVFAVRVILRRDNVMHNVRLAKPQIT